MELQNIGLPNKRKKEDELPYLSAKYSPITGTGADLEFGIKTPRNLLLYCFTIHQECFYVIENEISSSNHYSMV